MNKETIPGGLLVAIEGIDGAGKSTLARALAERLEQAAEVSLSKEPTSGPWGQKLRATAATGRMTPEEEADLLLKDRRQHVEELIAPALAAGAVVILDRYYPSMVAYQGAAGLDQKDLTEANAFAPAPDLLLVLDVEPAMGLARIRARGDAPNHFETPANLELCRAIFRDMRINRTYLLDASASAGDVLEQAYAAVVIALADKLAKDGVTPENVTKLDRLAPRAFA